MWVSEWNFPSTESLNMDIYADVANVYYVDVLTYTLLR